MEHSNLVSPVAGSPMHASDADRMQTSSLVGYKNGALWPAAPIAAADKQLARSISSHRAYQKAANTHALGERLTAREICEDLVAAANNEAKARLQLSALRLNRSQMHQEADQLPSNLFSTFAATSNLGLHANP